MVGKTKVEELEFRKKPAEQMGGPEGAAGKEGQAYTHGYP